VTAVPVSTAVAAWASDYTVKTPAAATYDESGRVASPSYATRTVRAVVQTVGGSDLRQLPEGQREGVTRIAYCLSAVDGVDKAALTAGELFEIDGDEYQITRVDRWGDLGFGGYWAAWLRRRVD